jgi:hypothetical protein
MSALYLIACGEAHRSLIVERESLDLDVAGFLFVSRPSLAVPEERYQ